MCFVVIYDEEGVWFYGQATEVTKFDFRFNQELKIRTFETEENMIKFVKAMNGEQVE